MSVSKLSARQQSQLDALRAYPAKFDRIHRLIEEIAALRADESLTRSLCRLLDEMKAHANSLTLNALADTLGLMSTMARRGGGLQMKVRGLREGLVSLRVNYEGAIRSAMTISPEGDGGGGAGN